MGPLHAGIDKNAIRIDMEIKFPQKEKKKKVVPIPKPTTSDLSELITQPRTPESVYFQSVDCLGMPSFLSPQECKGIIDYAENRGFNSQEHHKQMNPMWYDIIDPFFCEALWQRCGLSEFFETISVSGLVPCGLNDVVRIQKYVKGSYF